MQFTGPDLAIRTTQEIPRVPFQVKEVFVCAVTVAICLMRAW